MKAKFILIVAVILALAATAVGAQALPDSSYLQKTPGKLDVEIPEAERLPMTHIGAPENVERLSADRKPFTEEYRQSTADLPESPLRRPAPPSVSALTDRPPRAGMVEATAGRYGARAVNVQAHTSAGKRTTAWAGLNYEGSSGHQTEGLPGERTNAAFDVLSARLGLGNTASRIGTGAEVDAATNSWSVYRFPGNPSRSTYRTGARAWLETRAGNPLIFSLDARGSTGAADTKGFSSLSETVGTIEARIGGRLIAGDLLLAGRATGAGVSTSGTGGTNIDDAAVGASGTYRFMYRRYYKVTLGGHYMTVSTTDPSYKDHTFIAPEARVEFYPVVGLRVFGQNVPSVTYRSLLEVLETNPWITEGTTGHTEVRTIDAQAGANLFLGPLQVGGHVGLIKSPEYLYFETTGSGMAARRSDARIAYIAGDVTMTLPGGFTAGFNGRVRDGALTDLDSDIPYVGALEGSGSLSYAFARNRGLIQTTVHYEGARTIAINTDEEINALWDVDITGSWYVTPAAAILVRLDNAVTGNLEPWAGYTLPPASFQIGARLRW